MEISWRVVVFLNFHAKSISNKALIGTYRGKNTDRTADGATFCCFEHALHLRWSILHMCLVKFASIDPTFLYYKFKFKLLYIYIFSWLN